MAAVLNRTTKQYLPSANTPEYPTAQWIHNPDLSAVAGFPSIYWIITGDVVTLMTPAEMASVDQAILDANRDSTADKINDPEELLRGYAMVNLDDRNDFMIVAINGILNAIDQATTLADLKSRIALLADVPIRTGAQYRNQIRAKLGT